MTSYREAAVTLWGDAGAYAHDSYTRHRHLCPGLPAELPIVIGISAYGGCDGLTRADWRHGPRISLASTLFRSGERAVDDVMLHEMVHVWLAVNGRNNTHDSEAWYAAVRRLSPAVLGHALDVQRGADRRSVRVPNPEWAEGSGLPKTLVRKQRVPGADRHGTVATWPRSYRPAAFDWGRPIDCPTY